MAREHSTDTLRMFPSEGEVNDRMNGTTEQGQCTPLQVRSSYLQEHTYVLNFGSLHEKSFAVLLQGPDRHSAAILLTYSGYPAIVLWNAHRHLHLATS